MVLVFGLVSSGLEARCGLQLQERLQVGTYEVLSGSKVLLAGLGAIGAYGAMVFLRRADFAYARKRSSRPP